MTPDEADQRIITSRQTLARYQRMTGSGLMPAFGTIALVDNEISFLATIGGLHPIKHAKLAELSEKWAAFRNTIRATLH